MRLHATSIIILISLLLFGLCCGETPGPWQLGIKANLTTTVNTYSDNWAGGEAGSAAWSSQLNTFARKQVYKRLNIENKMKLAFGQTYLQNQETKAWMKPEKSTDLVDVESVLKFTAGGYVDPFVGFRLLSQFLDNKNPDRNYYFNPVDMTESFGAAKNLAKTKQTQWSLRLGGAVRQLINRNVLDTISTKQETEITHDGGLELVTELKTANQKEWLSFESMLKIYQALLSSESEALEGTASDNDWQYPDINWENILYINLTQYFMINLYVQVLYDKDIDKNIRLKETLSIGLTYSFQN